MPNGLHSPKELQLLQVGSTKRRNKIGSFVAYKTIGTFLSQNMGHGDASGQATDRCKTVALQRYADVVAKSPFPFVEWTSGHSSPLLTCAPKIEQQLGMHRKVVAVGRWGGPITVSYVLSVN